MSRRLAALLAALALASACQAPTAPLQYEGPCELAVPKDASFVHICYNICPPDAAAHAAGLGMAYAARTTPCGTGAS